jgi:hypothetical protein
MSCTHSSIERIDCGGLDTNEHLSGRDFGFGQVDKLENLRPAIRLKLDRFHKIEWSRVRVA